MAQALDCLRQFFLVGPRFPFGEDILSKGDEAELALIFFNQAQSKIPRFLQTAPPCHTRTDVDGKKGFLSRVILRVRT